ncbi:MAG: TRAP transporter small permease [Pararhodobacter sp.]|nr:TRAP transporter small permease [Pararhodobacter sp.]
MQKIERLVGAAVGGLAFAGGLVILLSMALLTVIDVMLRQFGMGIPGSWELVTFAMRWMIGLSLPYAFWTGRHVAVEAFVEMLPKRTQLVFILFGEILAAGVMGLLAWRLWVRASQILDHGTRTSDLGILVFYNWLPLILGCALSCLVLLVLILRSGRLLYRRGDTEKGMRP